MVKLSEKALAIVLLSWTLSAIVAWRIVSLMGGLVILALTVGFGLTQTKLIERQWLFTGAGAIGGLIIILWHTPWPLLLFIAVVFGAVLGAPPERG